MIDVKAKAAKSDLVVTRTVNAPRELVFKAWTEPERLMRWWGPKGFTTPACKVDLRVGGLFLYCMRSPEGKDFWGRGIFQEIVPPERIVYLDSFSDAEGNLVPPAHYGLAGHAMEALCTVTFTESSGKTKITLRHALGDLSAEFRDGTKQGWIEMLGKLADLVGKPLAARSGKTKEVSR